MVRQELDIKFLVKIDGKLDLYSAVTVFIPELNNVMNKIRSIKEAYYLVDLGFLKVADIICSPVIVDESLYAERIEALWLIFDKNCKVIGEK